MFTNAVNRLLLMSLLTASLQALAATPGSPSDGQDPARPGILIQRPMNGSIQPLTKPPGSPQIGNGNSARHGIDSGTLREDDLNENRPGTDFHDLNDSHTGGTHDAPGSSGSGSGSGSGSMGY